MKKKNIVVVVLVAVLLVLGLVVVFLNRESELTKYSENTVIEKTESYKLDLRIYGSYDKKSYNKIIMVSNYKNTDKNITITDSGKEEKVTEYVVKDKKKYQVSEGCLSEVEEILYDDTDIYLSGIEKMKDVKEETSQEISATTYKVYSGVVSDKVINNIIAHTDLDITVESNVNVEVWLTPTNEIYKVYYRVKDLTIYASYFGFGKINSINLDQYK